MSGPPAPRGVPPLRSIALVAAGGGVGALARVALSAAVPASPGALPWTTLAENVSGAFLLCLLLTVLVERLPASTAARPLLATGVLGAYTTFATVGLELHLLVAAGDLGVAGAYVAATWLGGLAAGGLGIVAARALPRTVR